MDVRVVPNISAIDNTAWNRLIGADYPFMRHEFLSALERHACVGPHSGWTPRHVVAYAQGEPIGAIPLYLKGHSWGEFVFDWSWAEAYQRSGQHYYPKLVVAAPYTPATGPRLLAPPTPHRQTIIDVLVEAARNYVQSWNVSSLHWLFTTAEQTAELEERGFLVRLGCQYHWKNHAYESFDAFLATFSAQKRKKVKRERRRVQEMGISTVILGGEDATDQQWDVFYQYYCSTLLQKSGHVPLSLEFFRDLGHSMPESIVLVLAYWKGAAVAAALSLRSSDTLYGRYWGAAEHFDSLHFECCYYAGIEYCISHKLQSFEPGAQGEHKISRGFVPSPTYSAHWLRNADWQRIIADFLCRERKYMEAHMANLQEHVPYKDDMTDFVP